jgi:hypothetical protein
MAARGGSPPEVEVVAEDREVVVEAAELVEHAAADQHPGGVDREHLADLVVLPLVVLARLQPGLAAAGAGQGDADLQQPLEGGPLAQLRTEDVDARVVSGGVQQPGQGVRCGVAVVVQQPDPFDGDRTLGRDLLQGGADRLGVSRSAGERHDFVVGVEQEVDALVTAAGVDRHHAGDGDRLRAQTVDHGGKPPGSVVADQKNHDCRCHGRSP